jgi:hypothetical protein
MHLGTLIAELQHEPEAAAALHAIGDVVLFARISEMAHDLELAPGEYVSDSVSRFANAAGDDAWLGLIATIERAPDPGSAALKRMLEWALQTDTASTRDTDGHAECEHNAEASSSHTLP